jgi:rod shape-determining protein MreC
VSFRDGPFQDLRVPLAWTAAAATIVAVIAALSMLLADKRDARPDHKDPDKTAGFNGARSQFDEVISPISGLFAAPLRWTGGLADDARGYFNAVDENKKLRKEVADLQRWKDAAIALKNANQRYEALLKLRVEPDVPTVAARVVQDSRGPFSNARIADAGAAQGVKVGNPVISEHGVVGRVVGVAKTASRILLLTDVESRTPVMVDRTNARAILTGDGGAEPSLNNLRGREPAREGDIILTSGDGGLYPRGLPVGVATKDLRGVWRVRLYSDRAPIDYVRILEFQDFSQLAEVAALDNKTLPPLSAADSAQVKAALEAKLAPPPAPKPAVATTDAAASGKPASDAPAKQSAKPADKAPDPKAKPAAAKSDPKSKPAQKARP